jgi:hypothetical protein
MDDEFQTARVAQEQQLTVLEKATMRSRISIRQHIQGIEHAFEEAGASIGVTSCRHIFAVVFVFMIGANRGE